MKVQVTKIAKAVANALPQPEMQLTLDPARERARLIALALLPHEELVARLWAREMIPDDLAHIAIGISDARYQRLKSEGIAPPRVMIGDRRFVLTSDLRDWVRQLQKTTELRRRERKDEGVGAPVNAYQQLQAAARS